MTGTLQNLLHKETLKFSTQPSVEDGHSLTYFSLPQCLLRTFSSQYGKKETNKTENSTPHTPNLDDHCLLPGVPTIQTTSLET